MADESDSPELGMAKQTSYSRSHSMPPRIRPSSPRHGGSSRQVGTPSRFALEAEYSKYGRRIWPGIEKMVRGRSSMRRRFKGVFGVIWLVAAFLFFNWWMISRIRMDNRFLGPNPPLKGEWTNFPKAKRPQMVMFSRLLALAAHALAEVEKGPEPVDLWKEPIASAAWVPCSDQRTWKVSGKNNGYILVSAGGGINQQRVAVCNAVAVARLLNATLVIPIFLYNSVWKDTSQFADIFQEEYFINYLKDDIRIVRELPLELLSLDLEAIGSIVTDADVMKEAKPSFFLEKILPILLQNRVVHFVGFGNRLAFDPIPFQLQRLRCRCNYHALRFTPRIQEAGALLVQRMHQNAAKLSLVAYNLFSQYPANKSRKEFKVFPKEDNKYLALHLRFEIDMAAYSLCEFGGGEVEGKELEAYRSVHFPALTQLKNNTKLPSAGELRSDGQCPLTPEEAALMLSALGFKRGTHIFLAGAHVYGGKSKMLPLATLYPNVVTKEDLLSSKEIQPFRNFSSQMAALDFIGCAAAAAFAMTDSGSQFSAMVAGYRAYYGGGSLPTIRPNKRRLATIFTKNSTIEWEEFQRRVRKAVRETKKVQERPLGRSVYRHPWCHECMCEATG